MPVDTIFEHPAFAFQPTDKLIDLGAGVGKPTALAVLEYGAASGIGVELSPTRFHAGCEALGRLAAAVTVAEDVADDDSSEGEMSEDDDEEGGRSHQQGAGSMPTSLQQHHGDRRRDQLQGGYQQWDP